MSQTLSNEANITHMNGRYIRTKADTACILRNQTQFTINNYIIMSDISLMSGATNSPFVSHAITLNIVISIIMPPFEIHLIFIKH